MVLFVWCVIAGAGVLGVVLGHWIGKSNERDRCRHLCTTSYERRFSGSVRWVYNAIDSGAEDLMPSVEFFGPSDSRSEQVSEASEKKGLH